MIFLVNLFQPKVRGQYRKKTPMVREVLKLDFVAKETVTQGWPQIFIMVSKKASHLSIISLLWCHWYDGKSGIVFRVALNLLKIKLGKDKISESKIDISILKTTGIDPLMFPFCFP